MKKGLVRRQSGFVLISLAVFLFLAALVALGDMRTLAVQQTVVTTMYAAQNAMAETESALATMEQFAAFEGSELGKPEPEGNARLTTLTNPSTTNCTNGSEPAAMACIKRSCNSFLYPQASVTGDDNVTGGNTAGDFRQLRTGSNPTECSFCPPPTPACKARWDEAPGGANSPWAKFNVNFYRNETTPSIRAADAPQTPVSLKKDFYGMVEYLGWAQCNLTDMDPSGTNLDVYSGFTVGGRTRGCRVMRVTVRNIPPTVSKPTITLQSTLLVASVLNYPGTYSKLQPPCCLLVDDSRPASSISKNQAKFGYAGFRGAIDAERISWRQIFPK